MTPAELPALIFLIGPTATGKSELALQICEAAQTPFEIINADSVQVYQQIEIGTSKPSAADLKRVPHHLLSIVAPPDVYTAGRYRRDALAILQSRIEAGVRGFVVVGGSGFYVQALEKGMFEIGQIDEQVREQIARDHKALGAEALHQEVAARDPEYAQLISPHDTYRILRALEILRGSNKTPTLLRAEFRALERELHSKFNIHKFGLHLERDVLRKKIAVRTKAMLESGWCDEVERLRSQGLRSWAPLQSVGYREVGAYLDGEFKLSDLPGAINTSTAQLAKRQRTWFARDKEIQWLNAELSGQDLISNFLAAWRKP